MLLPDEEFLAAFQSLTLHPSEFNHLGHLRISWIFLQRAPLDEAIQRVCGGILNYASHLGAAAKFHRTITEALLRLMHMRGAADPALSWEKFVALNPDLVVDAKTILLRHYSEETLSTDEARVKFVAPDREPLPCMRPPAVS
jgi:hypothetical protein